MSVGSSKYLLLLFFISCFWRSYESYDVEFKIQTWDELDTAIASISDTNNDILLNITNDFTYMNYVNVSGIAWPRSLTILSNNNTINGEDITRFILVNNSNVFIMKTVFINGKASNGGFGWVINEGNLTIDQCIFDHFEAVAKGAVVYNEASTCNIYNSTFNDIKAGEEGGVIFVGGGYGGIYGSLLTNIEAYSGGGWFAAKSIFYFDDNEVYNAVAEFEGAVGRSVAGGWVYVHNVTAIGLSAFVSTFVGVGPAGAGELSDIYVSDTSCGRLASVTLCLGNAQCEWSNILVEDWKGGVAFVSGGADLTLNDVHLRYGSERAVIIGQGSSSSINNLTVEHISTLYLHDDTGGAIEISTGGAATVHGLTCHNISGQGGNCILLEQSSTITADDVSCTDSSVTITPQFDGNDAGGTCILIDSGSVAEISNFYSAHTSSPRGGSVVVVDGSELILSDSRIIDSNATQYGGCIYNEGELTLNNVLLSGCYSGDNGSVIYNYGTTGESELTANQIEIINPSISFLKGQSNDINITYDIYNGGEATLILFEPSFNSKPMYLIYGESPVIVYETISGSSSQRRDGIVIDTCEEMEELRGDLSDEYETCATSSTCKDVSPFGVQCSCRYPGYSSSNPFISCEFPPAILLSAENISIEDTKPNTLSEALYIVNQGSDTLVYNISIYENIDDLNIKFEPSEGSLDECELAAVLIQVSSLNTSVESSTAKALIQSNSANNSEIIIDINLLISSTSSASNSLITSVETRVEVDSILEVDIAAYDIEDNKIFDSPNERFSAYLEGNNEEIVCSMSFVEENSIYRASCNLPSEPNEYILNVLLNDESVSNSPQIIDVVCSSGFYINDNNECLSCPQGALCESIGLNIETITINEGYWRVNIESTEIIQCPAGTASCRGDLSIDIIDDLVDNTTALYCQPGHLGPICQICEDGYYLNNDEVCKECPNSPLDGVPWVAILLFGSFIIVLICFLLLKNLGDRVPIQAKKVALLLQVKLKQLFIFLQIIVLIAEVYGLFALTVENDDGNSSESKQLKEWFKSISFFSFDVDLIGAIYCVVDYNSHDQLLVLTLVPICLTSVLGVAVYYFQKRLDDPGLNRKEIQRLVARINTIKLVFIILTFIVYAPVSSLCFQTFDCRDFDDGSSFWKEDWSINCNSPSHQFYQVYAVFMIIIYSVGIPFVYWRILSAQKENITTNILNYRPPQYIIFLMEDYKTEYWWFEILESARKVTLTGIVAIVSDEGLSQEILGLVFALVFLVVIAQTRPYALESDNNMAFLAQFIIFCTIFLITMFKVHSIYEEIEIDETFSSNSRWDNIEPGLNINLLIYLMLFIQIGFLVVLAWAILVDVRKLNKDSGKEYRFLHRNSMLYIKLKRIDWKHSKKFGGIEMDEFSPELANSGWMSHDPKGKGDIDEGKEDRKHDEVEIGEQYKTTLEEEEIDFI